MISGRANETKYLENCYNREGSQMLVVYGREGVGKTSLLMDFVTGKEYDYYLARSVSEKEQLSLIAGEMECESSYDAVISKILSVHCRKKIVIIDEFHHAVKNSQSFMDEMVQLLHRSWDNQPVLLILCSSAFSWVENDMVSQIGQAAYEITGFLKIKELSFLDLVRYFSAYSTRDCMSIYGVLGGVPRLWKAFDKSLSVEENIIRAIIQKDGPLHGQALFEISERLREPAVYHTIISRMAAGEDKLNDIHASTGFSRAKISVYLKNLMELEITEKVYSVDVKGRDNARKGIYRIKNHLIAFWFTFVFPHLSALEFMDGKEFYDAYVADSLRHFEAPFFKDVCREFMSLMNRSGALPIPVGDIGCWSGKTGDIDILASANDGRIIAGVCCWDKDTVTFEDFEWLEFCLKQAKVSADYIYMFTGGGFDDRLLDMADNDKSLKLIDPNML